MYQGGTERGYDSVNIYDKKNRVIAVFKKQSDEKLSLFTTSHSQSCQKSIFCNISYSSYNINSNFSTTNFKDRIAAW